MKDDKALTPTAAKAIAELLALLSSGFTGTVTLECHGGGVRQLRKQTVQQFGKTTTEGDA